MNSITLKTGRSIPSVGIGFWKVEKSATANVVVEAIKAGYRHLDCACDYGNEKEVGQGIQQAISDGLCTRDELWVTSKLWNTYHRTEHVRPAIEKSLADLQLDYLDLYLIHFPIASKFVPFEAEDPKIEADNVPISETWAAMEELVATGLAHDIGVCNFGTSLLRDLASYAKIPPAVLQIESHPFLTQDKLIRYCKEQQIVVTAFSPLGALSYFALGMAEENESVIATYVVTDIAAKHGRTPAQIVLRWGVQRGTSIVPKTSKPERMIENISLFDFELSDDEMAAISGLDCHRRFNDPGHFCEAAFNTFFPIYE
ncbi:UNVERIFIED_CONTAM: hypothetical protein GTU68_039091 [Idotea baltica]|nr:hypothetical protein [Idotea baltica]